MSLIDIKVPDIGDFKGVPVIEIHVKPGDVVEPEAPLITLESDKATMEVPAPQAGKVSELLLKIGDKVSEGTPILRLDGANGAGAAAAKPEAAPVAPAVQTQAEAVAPAAFSPSPAQGRSVP